MTICKTSKVNRLSLTGDNFEIGRGLGRFWGDYFYKLNERNPCNELYEDYEEWLRNDKIDEDYGELLSNMVQHFPALFRELVGMNVGINESKIKFKTSLFGLFTCWLGETDESFKKYNGCSSVLLPTKNGFFLAHSDEDDKRYPLVVADVSLININKIFHFISISHPFQLLGSAAGMNSNFAFQGNSIGCIKKIFDKLRDTWRKRIPKTVFTRMMLEMSSIDEIKAIYRNYESTLPNHHYVVFSNKAYSIGIGPYTKRELVVRKMEGNSLEIHTNHFLRDSSHRSEYTRKDESSERCKALRKKMKGIQSVEQIESNFLEFLNEYPLRGRKLIKRTSGAFFFTIQKGKPFSCKVELYYEALSSRNLPV